MMSRIDKLLVANRSEIACRVMRSAKICGMATVAVYSEADADALHVRMADEAVLIGAAPATQSYLRGDKIIEAALKSGADAIHPGYGFLSENADFAKAVEKAGLVFVGPTAQAIQLMGNKAEAKRRMIEADVPCVPGYEGQDQSDDILLEEGKKIGFPLMVKATAGGGGRGMRLVEKKGDLAPAIAAARSEAENAFGSGELILEKAIIKPRHVEIQVFADTHGTCLYLGERDCSVQRRHQKVIEEAPCPIMTEGLRTAMGEAAVNAARAIDYRGAGTVEFLLDSDGATFYFLEMNTRLQVEHPVTEEITGLDLVAMQLQVAQGNPLGMVQDDITLRGHSIEVRLYAEDPSNQFLPSTGLVRCFQTPQRAGVRLDTGIESGQTISPFYDPMIAKLITTGENREAARRLMVDALKKTALFGVRHNRDFLIGCLQAEAFVKGDFSTAFIAETFGEEGVSDAQATAEDIALLAVRFYLFDRAKAHKASLGLAAELLNFTSNQQLSTPYRLEVADQDYAVMVHAIKDGLYEVQLGTDNVRIEIIGGAGIKLITKVNDCTMVSLACQSGAQLMASIEGRQFVASNLLAKNAQSHDSGDGRQVAAPMHGNVVEIFVAEGDKVQSGARLLVLEAMKMQHETLAQIDGTIAKILVVANQQVGADDLMIEITTEEEK